MGERSKLQSVLLVVLVVVISRQFVYSIPVSTETGRVPRSVSSHRHTTRNENPANSVVQQPSNNTLETVLAAREIGGGNTTSPSTSGVGSSGGGRVVSSGGGGANGTFSNGTEPGSRLSQNETEPCSLEPNVICTSDPSHSNRDKQRRIAHIVTFLWTNLFGNRTQPVINKDLVKDRFTPAPSSSSFSGDLESIAASCDLPSDVESEAWSSEQYLNLYFNLTSKYQQILGTVTNSENPVSLALSSSRTARPQESDSGSTESGQSSEYPPVNTGMRPVLSANSAAALSPNSARNRAVNVIRAKLRLYQIGLSERNNVPSFADIVLSQPCNDTESTLGADAVVPSVFPSTATAVLPATPSSTEEKIRVSIFWYTRPATKNHYKKKLLDAKMLSLGTSQWVEFDIKNAVTAWLNERKPNYGIVVEVENENQDALDPKKYFRGVPCEKTSAEEAGTQKDDNSDGGSGTAAPTRGESTVSTSPMIEICTLNVADNTQASPVQSQNQNQNQAGRFLPYSININSLDHLQRIADSHAKSSHKNGSAQARAPWQNINLRALSPDDFRTDSIGNERSGNSQQPTTTVIFPSHKHRHHHQLNSRNENSNNITSPDLSDKQSQHHHQHHSSSSSNDGQAQSRSGVGSHPPVIFDEDHPLRDILAAVNGNSKESSRRRSVTSGSHRSSETVGRGRSNSEMPADEGRVSDEDYLDSSENERNVFITKIVMTPAQLKESGLSGFANGRRGLFSLPTPMSSVLPTESTGTSTGSLSDR